MSRFLESKAQVLFEYVTVIVCLLVALMAMQFYIRRAVQGSMRESSDNIGDQYEPGASEVDLTTMVVRDTYTEINRDSWPNTVVDGKPGYGTYEWEVTTQDDSLRFGSEAVGQ